MSSSTVITILLLLLILSEVAVALLWRYARREHRKVVTLQPIAEREAKRKAAMQGKTIIYAIPDPKTQQICYVGMTMKHEVIRLKEHVDEALHVSAFHLHIRERISEGYQWDTIIVLEACETRSEAYKRETHWIRHGRDELGWPLQNGARRKL